MLVLLGEFIIRKEILDLQIWLLDNKLAFYLNVLIIAVTLLLSVSITKSMGIGTLITGVVYITLCVVNFYKYILKGEFLTLYDFVLVKEGLAIVKEFNIKLEIHIVQAMILFTIIVIISWQIKFKYKTKDRYIFFLVCLIFMCGVMKGIYFNKSTLKNLGVEQDIFFNRTNYIDNGFALTLVTKLKDISVKKPKNYSRKAVLDIVEKYYTEKEIKTIKPNIIMIMDEALFDITKISGLKLSGDPLERFHKYQQQFSKGSVIVPVFGGLTAQTEYEVLTGNSVEFIGSDNIAYINYVKPGMNSLVDTLNKTGYTTLAIHPYIRDFYKRDKVYEYLKFDKYISMESIEKTDENTRYISDKDTFKKIIYEMETRKTNEPVFMHVVTMQNHAPYIVKNNEIKVLNQELSADALEQVSGYVEGLKKFDQALEYLIDYFSNAEEPTLIIVYGDHAPLLGSFYTEIEYTTQEKIDRMLESNLYTVPLMIWNNYGAPQKNYENIDATYLGAVLLDIIGVNTNKYFKVLQQIMPLLKAYNYKFILDANNNYILNEEIKKDNLTILDELRLLQYDRIFGKKYIEGEQYE